MPGRNGRPLGRGKDRKVSEFIDQAVTIAVRELRGAGVTEDQARELATQIVHQICVRYAKTTMYIPGLVEIELTKRDLQLWEAYCRPGPTGSRACSHERLLEIAAERDISERQLYNVFRLARRREIEGRQGTLPGLETS